MRVASGMDVVFSISVLKYYAGWADKITGQTLEVSTIGRALLGLSAYLASSTDR